MLDTITEHSVTVVVPFRCRLRCAPQLKRGQTDAEMLGSCRRHQWNAHTMETHIHYVCPPFPLGQGDVESSWNTKVETWLLLSNWTWGMLAGLTSVCGELDAHTMDKSTYVRLPAIKVSVVTSGAFDRDPVTGNLWREMHFKVGPSPRACWLMVQVLSHRMGCLYSVSVPCCCRCSVSFFHFFYL